MNLPDIATTAGGVVAVGSVIGTGMGLWINTTVQKTLDKRLLGIERQTRQLDHNGGSHVADYARDARDESRKTNDKLDSISQRLSDHMIESAARHAERDGKIAVITEMLKK